LIFFGGEMVMGLSFINDISGKIGLSQESVGSNGFSLNINSIEKRDGSLDFICLFFLAASFYR
jgi:hypothetical protein